MVDKIIFLEDTILKPGHEQAKSYFTDELYPVKAGTEYSVAEWTNRFGHIKFTLHSAMLQGKDTWYAFDGHAQIWESQPRKPEDAAIALKPVAREQLISIPGFQESKINLYGKIGDSKYFTWAEALHFDGSLKSVRIPRTTRITENIIKAAKRFDAAREHFGSPLTVTSWYRDPKSNLRAGGATRSQHLTGLAIDVKAAGHTGKQLYKIFDPMWHGGLGQYPKTAHSIVHLDIAGNRRWKT